MALEVSDSSSVIIENGSEPKVSMDNKKVSITFGSHGSDESVKVDVKNAHDSDVPKNAVDDWPEPRQIHSFYIVRYRALEDQTIKGKLDVAERELQKKNQARMQIVEKIKTKRADRAHIIAQIRTLSAESKEFRSIMDEKRKEMEPLTQALGMLRGSGGGQRGSAICSSEAELNNYIKSLQYRIQHESIPLTEEKQILRDIKQLEGTRQKVIAHASERAMIEDSLGEKNFIQGQVKLIGVDLDGVRKEKQVVQAKLNQLDAKKKAIDKDIDLLEAELKGVTDLRNKTFDTITDMRKQRDEGNSPFYENRALLIKAKQLAANKEVDALKELAETEVDKFMSIWNSNKAFRDDYEKRILSSLDMRQLSRDGRLRNANEKPLVRMDAPTAKQIPKEEAVAPAKDEDQKVPKTKGDKEGNRNKENELSLGKMDEAEEEEYFTTDKSKESSVLFKKVEVDEKKLKESKREEEIAKRKEKEEKKKKQAEKAAVKAAIKAQKEAEKKLKEREKRARKKAGGAVTTAADSEESPTEAVEEISEPEKIEEKIEIPRKNKDRKDTARLRGGRVRGPDSLPKAILKRKKATNYWVWIAPAAILAIVLLMLVGFNYLT